ncbi:TPA: fimbrial protein, partial [Yersinia enterocolitica]
TSATCTLVQKDLQADFGDIVKGVSTEASQHVAPTFHLENCGNTVQNVKVTMTYTQLASANSIRNTGGAGDSLAILPTWDSQKTEAIITGTGKTFSVVNQSVDVPIHLGMIFINHSSAQLTVGDIAATASLTFEEQ